MGREIFAYIIHKEGVPDDSALELLSAALQIDPKAPATAVVAGSGSSLTAVCSELVRSYDRVWKIDQENLGYPNAAVIGFLLERVLPKGEIVLIPHEHFGMDLAPGLSVRLESAFLSDVIAFESIEEDRLLAVREEYNGMVRTHVAGNISKGCVMTIRS
ncbi:MAG: electron transfer flavoprotein subunit alpha/FixB family protein, partial [Thermodesulfobacteriota bacterium]